VRAITPKQGCQKIYGNGRRQQCNDVIVNGKLTKVCKIVPYAFSRLICPPGQKRVETPKRHCKLNCKRLVRAVKRFCRRSTCSKKCKRLARKVRSECGKI